ncbi:MAG TPA: hypothetical protein PK911_05110 [Candidatus Saccharibacteria bacterium]|nr:hypothetical protein [Candidatus Saccharibacteria bacterium]
MATDDEIRMFRGMTEGQKMGIIELVGELELDDAENSIENANRCLTGQGYHELQVMVHNYFYRAGINHMKNEIRDILGLPRLETEQEKKQREYEIKHPMGSRVLWDCPELEPHEFETVEGSAKLIPLGDDQVSMVVIGTKDRRKALRMMRRYERDWLEADLLTTDDDLQEIQLVWRAADGEYDGDSTHMFSWRKRDVKNNPKAIHAFLREA